jgi:hypothetical protein
MQFRSYIYILEVQKSVKEWAHTLQRGLPIWELESQIFRE